MIQKGLKYHHLILPLILLPVVMLVNVCLGSVYIPFKTVLGALVGFTTEEDSWTYIIHYYRLPKAITGIIAGGGLAISGLLMQTLFRNPLAGPFVLGISSGASLGVALVILGSTAVGGVFGQWVAQPWGLVFASGLGSFAVLLAVVSASVKIKDTMTLLIIGLMFGSLSSALVGVLSYFSTAQKLQQFVFWSFGSLGSLSWESVLILTICCALGLAVAVGSIKSMNALLLGPKYAESMGVSIKRTTLMLVIATSILAGSITAFTGPIAFIGLAVPHIVRQFIATADHRFMIPAVFLWGSIILLCCDAIAQVPFHSITLPINAITSLIGAPVVIWLLWRKKNLLF
jgi:iron complex transport system permease protein